MQTKGQNFYFWSGFRFQKWFNMSYEHMLKVRVLSNIDDFKKKILCEYAQGISAKRR